MCRVGCLCGAGIPCRGSKAFAQELLWRGGVAPGQPVEEVLEGAGEDRKGEMEPNGSTVQHLAVYLFDVLLLNGESLIEVRHPSSLSPYPCPVAAIFFLSVFECLPASVSHDATTPCPGRAPSPSDAGFLRAQFLASPASVPWYALLTSSRSRAQCLSGVWALGLPTAQCSPAICLHALTV